MGEELVDHHRIFDAGDDLDDATAAVAGLDVDVEHTLQVLPGSMKTKSSCERALRPGHGGPAFGGCGVFGRIRRAGLVALAAFSRRHLCTMGAVRGENAVEAS